MALPKAIRRLAPERLRDDTRLRALFVGAGLIPPRTMHSDADAGVLRSVAAGRRRVVEIGVYEGSSAAVLCEVLDPGAELHLIDPFGEHGWALPAGWGATEGASRRVVERARRRHDGPRVAWHVDYSAAVAARWDAAVDLVFIDGDHSEEGVRADWEGWNGFVAPGGAVAFHDARLSQEGGRGLPGPTAVVDALFRGSGAVAGWSVVAEADRTVAVVRGQGHYSP
jgi:predicted O-methyltransferase YrrM